MRTFFGVVFALLTLLCGGCSVAFIGSMGRFDSEGLGMVLTIGGVPALIFGLISWALLRQRSFTPTAKDPRYGRDTPPPPPTSEEPDERLR